MAPSRGVSPIPRSVLDELKRVVERWQQLPLDRALSRAPQVLAVAQSLADEASGCRGRSLASVPDLGPATLMHQLRVTVHDVFESAPDRDPASVLRRLTGIRRSL